MNLYLLRPFTDWTPWYDKDFGFVVRAEDENRARHLVGENGYPEEGWKDLNLIGCETLATDVEGTEEIIMRDHAAA